MEKAFLCHSSADKAYVDRVAKRLGRAKVVFDVMTFRIAGLYVVPIRTR